MCKSDRTIGTSLRPMRAEKRLFVVLNCFNRLSVLRSRAVRLRALSASRNDFLDVHWRRGLPLSFCGDIGCLCRSCGDGGTRGVTPSFSHSYTTILCRFCRSGPTSYRLYCGTSLRPWTTHCRSAISPSCSSDAPGTRERTRVRRGIGCQCESVERRARHFIARHGFVA